MFVEAFSPSSNETRGVSGDNMLRPAAVEPVEGEERIAPEPAAISGTALFNMRACQLLCLMRLYMWSPSNSRLLLQESQL